MRNKWVKIRCTEKEKEIIKRDAQKYGMNVSEYIRNFVFDDDRKGFVLLNKTGRVYIQKDSIRVIAQELAENGEMFLDGFLK